MSSLNFFFTPASKIKKELEKLKTVSPKPKDSFVVND